MRKATNLAKVQFPAPDVRTKVIPAPTDGWDAISPLSDMDPKRAVDLINIVPRPGFVELRAGSANYVTGAGALPVESLLVYRTPSSEEMYGATGTIIFNASVASAAPATVQSGLNSARWQYINFTPGGGTTVLQAVNGVDPLLQYNGTVWSNPAITALPAGLTTSDFINIHAQKRRIWYIPKNSTLALFMPTDAITGDIAGYLDLGALYTKGGYLESMAAWTIDGGAGPTDYVVFISSRGQIVIYSGFDPTDANNWTLRGTFDVAPPIGRRCAYHLGADVALITQLGVLPINQVLPFDPSADRSVALTARIQDAMSHAVQLAQTNFGWEVISFPLQTLILVNIPLTENSVQEQYVMNSLTGAWCRFTNWSANCFAIYNDNLYFGDNAGKVVQAWVGADDLGDEITGELHGAFNWFDDPGRLKRMTMLQPLLNIIQGNTTAEISISVDFTVSPPPTAPVVVVPGTTALWDFAIWDSSVWPIAGYVNEWLSVNAMGHALAIHLHIETTPPTGSVMEPLFQINAFNSIIELGGFP